MTSVKSLRVCCNFVSDTEQCCIPFGGFEFETKCVIWKREREYELIKLSPSILTHLLQILLAASRAHGAGVILVEDLVAAVQLHLGRLAGYDDGAAGLARCHLGAAQLLRCLFVQRGRRGRGRAFLLGAWVWVWWGFGDVGDGGG